MKEIILEGSLFTSRQELHNILKSELMLPEYYGKNLDALWDCLTTDIELPLKIQWLDFEKSQKFLGSYAEDTRDLFLRASEALKGNLEVVIS
ncbi:barstar family protein [Clostridium sp. 19966]|uniref:barstar family protein n=1 Tax=Clostridium sp. 19966 TaxID=2768166 RepID=UPI0028E08223|nr:barstar family protein [Clostridium sp. 19966]MDT8718019.1 barstar family protein [Clostridium sp. 19966]